MLFALAYSWLRLLLDLADVRLRVHNPEAELLLLRHQLRVVRRQVKSPQLNTADRTIMAALSQRVSRAALVGMLVQPETVLGWHPELVRRRWVAFGRWCGPGRPGLDPEIQKLIVQMAKGNPRCGLRPSPQRIAQARLCGFGDRDSQVAAPEPDRAGTVEIAADLEGVPAPAGFGGRADRLLQRGYRVSEAVVRPPIYGAGDEAGDLVRGDRPPRRRLGPAPS
jgi:hypothetical protein